MDTTKFFVKLLICVMVLFSSDLFAQGRGGKGAKPHKKVVVRTAPHHPHRGKMVVYHPYWRPKYDYHRRWVYFPAYNVYWDNYHQVYMYRNGAVWVTNTAPPPVFVNINLEKEKQYELKEADDELDDIYKNNESHQTEYIKE